MKIDPDAPQKIDAYIDKQADFARPILHTLRQWIRESHPAVIEDYKWGGPHFHLGQGLVMGVGGFKKHVTLFFMEGALIEDPYGLLTRGKGEAMRHVKLTSLDELLAHEQAIRYYLSEAFSNAEAGRKVDKKAVRKPLVVPDWVKEALQQVPEAWATFEGMSWSHRKEYLEYLTEAKREDTRKRRLARAIELLSQKKGLNDKYK